MGDVTNSTVIWVSWEIYFHFKNRLKFFGMQVEHELFR